VQTKIIIVLIDGLADTNHKDLGCKRFSNHFTSIDKTPLQVANIPVMNAIAKSGICGLHDPV